MQNLYITTIQTILRFLVSYTLPKSSCLFNTMYVVVPPPKFYVHLNPIQIMSDVDSCLWFNSFALNLHQSLLDSKQDISASDFTYIDVKIEAILPKVLVIYKGL